MGFAGICEACGNKQTVPHGDVRCRACGERGFQPNVRRHRKSTTKRERMLDRAATPDLRRLVEFILDEFGSIVAFTERFSEGSGGIRTRDEAVHRWISGKTGASWPRARRLANMMRARGWKPVELAPGAADMRRRKSYRQDYRKWSVRHPEIDPGRPGGPTPETLRNRRKRNDAGSERAAAPRAAGRTAAGREAPGRQAAEPAHEGDGVHRAG